MRAASRFRNEGVAALAALVAGTAAPGVAAAAERMLVLADERVPGGAETAAAAARIAGFEPQVGAPELLMMMGCSETDAGCYAKAGAVAGARWVLVIQVVKEGPPLVVVVRRYGVDPPVQTAALSGPLDAAAPTATLAELLAVVVGRPAPAIDARIPASPIGAGPPGAPDARDGGGGGSIVALGWAGGIASVGGVGLLGVAAGAALALRDVNARFGIAPNESLEDLRELDRMADRGRTWAMTANLSLAIGAAAVVAGLALLVMPRLVARRAVPAPGTETPAARVSIRPGPLGLEVRF